MLPFFVFGSWGYFNLGGGVELMVYKMVKGLKGGFEGMSGGVGLGIVFVVSGVFIYLALRNLMGLFPFVFVHTSHIMFTLGGGLIFWLMCFMIG